MEDKEHSKKGTDKRTKERTMEIETKYIIADRETADKLWEDKFLASMEEEGSRETIYMKAVYFDTEDSLLAENDIAFRVRAEGDSIFATLKWSGKNEGALHTREEINIPVSGETCMIAPDLSVFKESEIGKELIQLIGDRRLFSNVETGVVRRRFRIDTGKALIEVSVDTGEIITKGGNEPICEAEFELFSGDEAELERVSMAVKDKYGLVPGEKSKYARGLELAANAKK
ncbi:MAG: CYTH domain-containing protein [Firmicutes bacterium]|nr:CYTH domain-containing protein [Bacillota bacterium]